MILITYVYFTYHDKINKRYCIELNAPPGHHTNHVNQDHEYGEHGQQRQPHPQPSQHHHDNEHRYQTNPEAAHCILPHRQVLFVVDVEDAATKTVLFID